MKEDFCELNYRMGAALLPTYNEELLFQEKK
jgi:hypothetical protein